ncbi:LysM peptidoglycan-binding domain-containing protein [Paenibacillus athensensis]|nr:LysM peptidoglycan-binding domain-containing protein [Paenibacillus athensensis]MCD1257439.1 LysM peptidoglycan-binding domain-containing protein [Paenibacillus athensensis]
MYIAYSEASVQRAPQQVKLSVSKSAFHKLSLFFGKPLRFMAVFVVLLILLSCGAIVKAYAGSSNELPNVDNTASAGAAFEEPVKLTVERGDTLWSIAQDRLDQDSNIRSYIAKIKAFNHLDSSVLYEGQVLLLP